MGLQRRKHAEDKADDGIEEILEVDPGLLPQRPVGGLWRQHPDFEIEEEEDRGKGDAQQQAGDAPQGLTEVGQREVRADPDRNGRAEQEQYWKKDPVEVIEEQVQEPPRP